MQQRSVQPRQPTAPVVRQEDSLDAFQQATKDDLVLPIRKLVQGVSRKADTTKAGQYWDELSDKYKPQMNVAIIWMRRERTLFSESLDAGPICASNDAIKPRRPVAYALTEKGEVLPVEHGDLMTGPTCEDCDLNNSGCQFSYGLLCYDLDDSEMFVLRVGGASRGDWRRYLTKGQRDGVAAYAVTTIIGSEPRKYTKGSAFAITFKAGGALPEDTVRFMQEKVAQYQGIQLAEPVDDIPEVDVDMPEDLPGDPFE